MFALTSFALKSMHWQRNWHNLTILSRGVTSLGLVLILGWQYQFFQAFVGLQHDIVIQAFAQASSLIQAF